jgi:hypothetical protein
MPRVEPAPKINDAKLRKAARADISTDAHAEPILAPVEHWAPQPPRDASGWAIGGPKPQRNSSDIKTPNTAEIDGLIQLFSHPGWQYFVHWLRYKNSIAIGKCITFDAKANEIELSKNQGIIKLIGEVLGDGTPDHQKTFASRIIDSFEVKQVWTRS